MLGTLATRVGLAAGGEGLEGADAGAGGEEGAGAGAGAGAGGEEGEEGEEGWTSFLYERTSSPTLPDIFSLDNI